MNYAIVTGASRGIGSAIALRLAKEGYVLIITASKDTDGLARTLEAVRLLSPMSFSCICDVSDSEAVSKMTDFLKSTPAGSGSIFDYITILVNNAGIDSFSLVQDITDEEWNRIISTNLGGTFRMCRAFLPAMIRARKGSILNISSYWGICGAAMESAYCASKGAVNAFTLSLADEVRFSNIRANALACEYIDTEMNAGFTPEEIKETLKIMPSHRVISPEEVAEMVASILSDSCTLTGEIISMQEAGKLIPGI